jgi:hypothetical protein
MALVIPDTFSKKTGWLDDCTANVAPLRNRKAKSSLGRPSKTFGPIRTLAGSRSKSSVIQGLTEQIRLTECRQRCGPVVFACRDDERHRC